MATKKSNSRRKPSVKFWFLTWTQNQVLKLAMLNTNFRKKRCDDGDDDDNSSSGGGDDDDNNNNNNKLQQMTKHRFQQVAEDYQSGERLKEGTKIFILLSVQQKV